MQFKDHFSGYAKDYARFRPHYPSELFDFLTAAVKCRDLAWDCATGNGQAALGLAERFGAVIGTDASREQLDAAIVHPRIEYRRATAENCALSDRSVDLIVVAQALHWFDLDSFYKEVRRVARDGALIAVWYYFAGKIDGPVGDAIRQFDAETVKPYWPPEAIFAQGGYERLPFPFERIVSPEFQMRADWTIDDLCGYLATWSATRRYQAATGDDPIPRLRKKLEAIWPSNGAALTVRWPIDLCAGRVNRQVVV